MCPTGRSLPHRRTRGINQTEFPKNSRALWLPLGTEIGTEFKNRSRRRRGCALVSSSDSAAASTQPEQVEHLAPLVRRVVAARIAEPYAVEDIVQETLARILAVQHRLDGEHACSLCGRDSTQSDEHDCGASQNRERRHKHRLVDMRYPDDPTRLSSDKKRRTPSQPHSPGCHLPNATHSWLTK